MNDPTAPIGVFDSGVGGLTVLRALRALLPNERFLYLGDTARLPYGTKSPATVQRYARQAGQVLIDRGVKTLVVACNTASAAALPLLQAAYAPVPVVGVVAPGAAAVAPQAEQGVLVLATEATVRGGAYAHEILARNPAGRVYSRPCPLLVALAEEGRTDDALARLALSEYIAPAVQALPEVSSILLGCTHFPIFRAALTDLLDASIRVVDSAQTTAAVVSELLRAKGLLATTASGAVTLLATDGERRFRRVGAQFLGEPIMELELVDL